MDAVSRKEGTAESSMSGCRVVKVKGREERGRMFGLQLLLLLLLLVDKEKAAPPRTCEEDEDDDVGGGA